MRYVSNSLRLGGTYNAGYHATHGDRFDNPGDIFDVVDGALTDPNAALPFLSNGVYLVLTSPDVYVTDLCTGYCGWHSYRRNYKDGDTLVYAMVGSPEGNGCWACIPPVFYDIGSGNLLSPNGDYAADAMVQVMVRCCSSCFPVVSNESLQV